MHVKPLILTEHSEKKINWVNLLFFSITTCVGVVGGPLYAWHYGIPLSTGLLFLFFIMATGMSITVGYHRLFAHCTFKTNRVVEFLVLFFGAAAFEQSALRWASQHRDHHRYVDTELDPYTIKKGFFYAHVGWLIFWKHPLRYWNAKDLQKKGMVMHQHRYYYVWSVIAGILLPVAIGMLTGHALAAFVFAVCLRLTLVYHSTFLINSACHTFGKITFQHGISAKDHWLIAFFTYGEGYHNFHHRFPGDYRNAFRWYQWDPTKWLIFSLRLLGMARDLRTISNFRILEARFEVENQRLREKVARKINHPHLAAIKGMLDDQYGKLRAQLLSWENAAREYHLVLRQQMRSTSSEFRKACRDRVKIEKYKFKMKRRQWRALCATAQARKPVRLLGYNA